jgi:hypothetical protein
MVAERAAWRGHLEQVTRMDGWLCEVDAILANEAARALAEPVRNERMGPRLDAWRTPMAHLLKTSPLSEVEQESLRELVQGRATVRPCLVPCSEREDVPRTTTDRERSILTLTTLDRRVRGRTNGPALWTGCGVCYLVGAG